MKKIVYILAVAALCGSGCFPKCLKSHVGMVHHKEWVQFIPIGKTISPIFHPAYDAQENICDEYEK